MQKCGGLERAQLLDALFKLILLVFELLLFAQTLAFLERLVLAMSFFVRRIRRVDPFLDVRRGRVRLYYTRGKK